MINITVKTTPMAQIRLENAVSIIRANPEISALDLSRRLNVSISVGRAVRRQAEEIVFGLSPQHKEPHLGDLTESLDKLREHAIREERPFRLVLKEIIDDFMVRCGRGLPEKAKKRK